MRNSMTKNPIIIPELKVLYYAKSSRFRHSPRQVNVVYMIDRKTTSRCWVRKRRASMIEGMNEKSPAYGPWGPWKGHWAGDGIRRSSGPDAESICQRF